MLAEQGQQEEFCYNTIQARKFRAPIDCAKNLRPSLPALTYWNADLIRALRPMYGLKESW